MSLTGTAKNFSTERTKPRCEMCWKQLSSVRNLNRHMEIHFREKDNPKKMELIYEKLNQINFEKAQTESSITILGVHSLQRVQVNIESVKDSLTSRVGAERFPQKEQMKDEAAGREKFQQKEQMKDEAAGGEKFQQKEQMKDETGRRGEEKKKQMETNRKSVQDSSIWAKGNGRFPQNEQIKCDFEDTKKEKRMPMVVNGKNTEDLSTLEKGGETIPKNEQIKGKNLGIKQNIEKQMEIYCVCCLCGKYVGNKNDIEAETLSLQCEACSRGTDHKEGIEPFTDTENTPFRSAKNVLKLTPDKRELRNNKELNTDAKRKAYVKSEVDKENLKIPNITTNGSVLEKAKRQLRVKRKRSLDEIIEAVKGQKRLKKENWTKEALAMNLLRLETLKGLAKRELTDLPLVCLIRYNGMKETLGKESVLTKGTSAKEKITEGEIMKVTEQPKKERLGEQEISHKFDEKYILKRKEDSKGTDKMGREKGLQKDRVEMNLDRENLNTKREEKTGKIVKEKKRRKFGCALCGKFLSRRSYLEGHMRIHTYERPYICETCGKCFALKRSLTRHCKQKHPECSSTSKTNHI